MKNHSNGSVSHRRFRPRGYEEQNKQVSKSIEVVGMGIDGYSIISFRSLGPQQRSETACIFALAPSRTENAVSFARRVFQKPSFIRLLRIQSPQTDTSVWPCYACLFFAENDRSFIGHSEWSSLPASTSRSEATGAVHCSLARPRTLIRRFCLQRSKERSLWLDLMSCNPACVKVLTKRERFCSNLAPNLSG